MPWSAKSFEKIQKTTSQSADHALVSKKLRENRNNYKKQQKKQRSRPMGVPLPPPTPHWPGSLFLFIYFLFVCFFSKFFADLGLPPPAPPPPTPQRSIDFGYEFCVYVSFASTISLPLYRHNRRRGTFISCGWSSRPADHCLSIYD